MVVVILGGVQLYMTHRPRVVAYQAEPDTVAVGEFRLEVTLSFAAGPDPCALELEDAPSLLILFHGKPVLQRTDAISGGQLIVSDPVDGIVQGRNEFFVQATCANDAGLTASAIRVRILRDAVVIAEQTFWSEPGEAIQGALNVTVPPGSSPEAAVQE
ncbi:MAG: hypothetical protein R3C28_11025 [Pirellulaceae bacterium]